MLKALTTLAGLVVAAGMLYAAWWLVKGRKLAAHKAEAARRAALGQRERDAEDAAAQAAAELKRRRKQAVAAAKHDVLAAKQALRQAVDSGFTGAALASPPSAAPISASSAKVISASPMPIRRRTSSAPSSGSGHFWAGICEARYRAVTAAMNAARSLRTAESGWLNPRKVAPWSLPL